jgi:hypothetical protein
VNRWVALLLAVVGGAAGAWAATLGITGALFGFLWIFVFGGDPWPVWVDPVAGILLMVLGLTLWAAMAWAIWLKVKPRG